MSSHADSSFVLQDSLNYALGRPQAAAVLKQQVSDFKVDEELGFSFADKGEHLYLRVRKRNHSTTDIARRLAKTLQLREVDVGYAGMKDRRAETTQWFSVLSADDALARLDALQDDELQILEMVRNDRKLKIGSHRKNHFQLLLREVKGSKEELESRLLQIQQQGVPNYFGNQRFGREASNLEQARALLTGEADDDKHSRSRQGRQQKKRRGMLYSALRAYLFNLVLSERIAQGNWNAYVEGDVLNLNGTQRSFAVAAGGWDETLQQRMQEQDIHPTGVLAGDKSEADNYLPHGAAADIEDAVLAQNSDLYQALCRHGLQAGRRPLRFKVESLEWQWQGDDRLQLGFALSRGAYATSLLRELCLAVEPGAEQAGT